jgi:hypothetical protein
MAKSLDLMYRYIRAGMIVRVLNELLKENTYPVRRP